MDVAYILFPAFKQISCKDSFFKFIVEAQPTCVSKIFLNFYLILASRFLYTSFFLKKPVYSSFQLLGIRSTVQ